MLEMSPYGPKLREKFEPYKRQLSANSAAARRATLAQSPLAVRPI